MKVVPVILSGGAGSRLWPLSRPDRPKQFLALAGERTLFAETLARVADRQRFAPPIVVGAERHLELLAAELPGDARLVLEPAPRNTAPAIAAAALLVPPETPLLVMPSDHVIADPDAFVRAIDAALPAAAQGWLVAFAIAAQGPETGYGWLELGEPVAGSAQRVRRFVEKPDASAAQAMLDAGGYAWNGGIFLFRADAYLAALAEHAPAIAAATGAAMAGAQTADNVVRPGASAWAVLPAVSIDYAVMEKTTQVAAVPVAMGWSDLGSWDAFHALHGGGDVHRGDVTALDTHNCLLHADGVRVAAIGVSDLIVVASAAGVLVMPRGRAQDVKQVAEG